MASIRTDLNVVKVYVEKKWIEILCGKPKVNRKQDNNKRVACNNHRPYEINPQEEEVTIEFPDVAQHQLGVFENMMDRQNTGKMEHAPAVAIWKYDTHGKLVRDYLLRGLFIEEIEQEGNDAASVKGIAINPIEMHGKVQ